MLFAIVIFPLALVVLIGGELAVRDVIWGTSGTYRMLYLWDLMVELEDLQGGRYHGGEQPRRTVTSVGACLPSLDDRQVDRARFGNVDYVRDKSKVELTREYKFLISFENAALPDYLTEKVFAAYLAGAVPVYLGDMRAAQRLPPGSFVDAAQFPSPRALARHLLYLDRRDEAYARHFDFRLPGPEARAKSRAFLESFNESFTNRGENSFLCRVCEVYMRSYCEV